MGIFKLNGVDYMGGGGGTGDANYEELTQAEYDALTTEEKNNGTMYFITDAPDDTTIAPIIYSDEEREVGVWTDGRPLYQKTYSKTNVSNSNVLVDSNFTKSVINLVGYVCNGMDMNSPFSHEVMAPCVNGGAVLRVYTNDSGLYCNIDGLSSSYSGTVRFTIQYIKYADTPGSGKWAPSGVPAVHYSTEEKVVGTWIDGSTMYEKTVTFTVPSNNYDTFSSNITNFDSCVEYKGVVKFSNGLTEDINYNRYDGGSSTFYVAITSTGDVFFRTYENVTATAYITIRYTKSS